MYKKNQLLYVQSCFLLIRKKSVLHVQSCFFANYKQLLDEAFVISGIVKVEVSVISRS